MAADLDHATRVENDGGRYIAQLSDEWEIWGPNGGYLAAIALRAAGATAGIRQPRSFYCHFLSSPAFDAVELEVKALKRGRRAESFAVEMTQEGKPILHALVKTAAQGPGYSDQHLAAPDVPEPASLKTYEQLCGPTRNPQRSTSGTTWNGGLSTRTRQRSLPLRPFASGRASDRWRASRIPSWTRRAR
jgi:acyl-CoA thioesterase